MQHVTPDDLRKHALGALGYINRYGWRRGIIGDKSTGFCVVGAIDEYYVREHPPYGTRNLLIESLEDLTGHEPLHQWNDDYATQDRVADYLLRVAEHPEVFL